MVTYTRRELALLVGTNSEMVRSWERAGYLATSGKESRATKTPKPVHYSLIDGVVARVLAELSKARIELSHFQDAIRQLAKKLSRLHPDWSGWLVLAGDGMLETLTDDLNEALQNLSQVHVGIIVRVDMTSPQEGVT